MNKVTLSIILLIFYSSLSSGQTVVNINMTTSKTIGSDLTFRMRSLNDTTLIKIDFGDGVLVNKIVDTSITVITGKVVGTRNIKIYGSDIIHLSCGYNMLATLDVTKALNLETLECNSNQLTALNMNQNVAIKHLNCRDNKLNALDVTQNDSLLFLDCLNNLITILNVSNNIKLTDLICNNNKLTLLDVSKNPELKKISCGSNLLTNLDVSINTQLIRLNCENNKLLTLDVTRNTALQELVCSRNKLSLLNISNNTQLKLLGCSENVIPLLDVTKNIKLERLLCDYNKLSTLDLSKNIDLNYIVCSNNQLTVQDFSNNLRLRRLECNYNQISFLNISLNKALEYFLCDHNRLGGEIDLSDFLKLEYFDCRYNNLTAIHLIDRPQLWGFGCSGNRLTFSTIPIITNKSSFDFIGYSPQQNMPIVRSVNVGVPIDLNSQYSVKGNLTVYKWKTKGGILLVKDVDYSLNSGQTIFLKPQTDSVYCEMTNAIFPEFSGSTALKTTCTKVYFQPFLNVPADTLLSTYLPSIAFFTISSNTNWNITSDKSWLIANISSGMNNALVTLTVMENTETIKRTATITLSGAGFVPKKITLIQQEIPFDPQLIVSTDTIKIEALDTTTCFEISSNLDWHIISDQDWLQPAVTEGSGNEKINLSVTKNTGINSRTANITIIGNEAETQNIVVIQQGIPFSPQLAVSKNVIIIEASDTASDFEILSNLEWQISSDQDWLSITVSEGSGNSTIYLTSGLNPATIARTAILTIAGQDNITRKITLIQKGAASFLILPSDLLTLDEDADSTHTIDINSNIDWTVLSNRDWLNVNITSGSGNAQIRVLVQSNTSSESRTAELIFSGQAVSDQTVNVVQYGGFTGLTNDLNYTIKVFPNPASDFIIIENENPGSVIDELKLIDLEGSVVVTYKTLFFNIFKVDLQNFKSGTYILVLKKGKAHISEKIIKF